LLLSRELSSRRELLKSGSQNHLAWFKTNRFQIILDASDRFSLRCSKYWIESLD